METNSYNLNWENFNIEQIIGGATADGVRYLKLFLIDYKELFNVKVNAGCFKCINSYLNDYKLSKFRMENNSNYRLKEKYNNLPLGFGSDVLVNNINITDKYAKQIIENYKSINLNFKKSDLFELYPIDEEKVLKIEKKIEEIKVEKPIIVFSKNLKNNNKNNNKNRK